jgi:glycosyltransferase involved in cell wall biosynthesis
MATYNGEKYIKEQLESILLQLGIDDEVIISDDMSTDKTIKIIETFNDSRIHIYQNSKEKGYTKNFENALEKTTGDIIFLADQDDIWIHNKVKNMKKYLLEYDFVVSDNIIVDEKLNTIHKSHFQIYKTKQGFIRNLLLPRYVGACMAFKKEVLQTSLPFPKNAKLSAHDYWICLIAELFFQVYKLDEPLIKYRRHASNTSSGGYKSMNNLFHKLNVRIYTLIHLLKRFFR